VNILALDCGTKTGWASLVDGRIESGVQDFSLKRGESKGIRFLRFNTWLVGMLDLIKPHIVVYEMAHFRGGHATEILVGMTTRIEEFREERGIEYSSVHSATLKKFATGSGKANKIDMMKAAALEFGRIIDSDDEADALHALAWGREEFGG
jgi:Holliday junction resolvasome RuvABC endonuclease subunit